MHKCWHFSVCNYHMVLELPPGLPLIRGCEHAIALVSIPVLPEGGNSKKLIKELLAKG